MTKKPVAKKAPAKPVAKKPTPREPKTKTFAADYPFAHANGRTAAKRGISKEQTPAFLNDDERKAWLEGYGSLG